MSVVTSTPAATGAGKAVVQQLLEDPSLLVVLPVHQGEGVTA